jgi:hypothetical protein
LSADFPRRTSRSAPSGLRKSALREFRGQENVVLLFYPLRLDARPEALCMPAFDKAHSRELFQGGEYPGCWVSPQDSPFTTTNWDEVLVGKSATYRCSPGTFTAPVAKDYGVPVNMARRERQPPGDVHRRPQQGTRSRFIEALRPRRAPGARQDPSAEGGRSSPRRRFCSGRAGARVVRATARQLQQPLAATCQMVKCASPQQGSAPSTIPYGSAEGSWKDRGPGWAPTTCTEPRTTRWAATAPSKPWKGKERAAHAE